MCKSREKKKLLKCEENLRTRVTKQWEILKDSIITQPFLHIHPNMWGHQTLTWRRADLPAPRMARELQHVRPVSPSIWNFLAIPVSQSPEDMIGTKGDLYINISTVLTCRIDHVEDADD